MNLAETYKLSDYAPQPRDEIDYIEQERRTLNDALSLGTAVEYIESRMHAWDAAMPRLAAALNKTSDEIRQMIFTIRSDREIFVGIEQIYANPH